MSVFGTLSTLSCFQFPPVPPHQKTPWKCPCPQSPYIHRRWHPDTLSVKRRRRRIAAAGATYLPSTSWDKLVLKVFFFLLPWFYLWSLFINKIYSCHLFWDIVYIFGYIAVQIDLICSAAGSLILYAKGLTLDAVFVKNLLNTVGLQVNFLLFFFISPSPNWTEISCWAPGVQTPIYFPLSDVRRKRPTY